MNMYIFFITITIFLVIIFFSGSFFCAPWIPTMKKDFDRIAELAQLKSGMIFYDLGSGTGKMLFYFFDKYNISGVGIEISPILYLYSKIKSLLFYHNKVKIKYGNFLKCDLSKANVIYFFLRPNHYDKMEDKINSNLKKETKIIVSCWPLKKYQFVKISKNNNGLPYYLYIKL